MKRGRAGTVTHDYKRHRTTTLFAALNTLNGSEWLKFLRLIHGRALLPRLHRQAHWARQLHQRRRLELAIDLYVAYHNMDPKPFIRTARTSDILAKINACEGGGSLPPRSLGLGGDAEKIYAPSRAQRLSNAALQGPV